MDSFVSNLTGQSKIDLAKEGIETQKELQDKLLQNELEINKAKYSPERIKERNKQIVIISCVVIISVFIYIKFFK